jgi:hypothetical protein
MDRKNHRVQGDSDQIATVASVLCVSDAAAATTATQKAR